MDADEETVSTDVVSSLSKKYEIRSSLWAEENTLLTEYVVKLKKTSLLAA